MQKDKTQTRLRDLERLIRSQQDRLFALAYVRIGNRSDAEDILQDVFLKLFRSEESLRHVNQLEHYLIRSVCTHCGIVWSGQSFPHDDYIVESLPDSASCRDVISYAAAIAGCYAKMSRAGQLTFGWYGINMPLWDAEVWLDGGNYIVAASGDEADGGDF
ncbi:MAG: RNA polymerase sigma factor, partial [Lachnospiraceae bacterium]